MTFCRYDIAFGDFVLNHAPYFVDSISTYSAPPLNVNSLPRLTRPGSIVSQSRFEQKIVQVEGRIVAAGRDYGSLLLLTDILKRRLLSGRQNLKVGYPDGRVYLNALVQGQVEINLNEATYREIPFTVSFLCPDPLLTDQEITTTVDSDALTLVGGNEYSKTMVFDLQRGTAFSYPVFTITHGFLTYGITEEWIVNTSIEGSPRITVPRTVSALEVLEIDGDLLTVKVNDIDVPYDGQFVPIDRRAGATNNVELHVIATSTPTVVFQAAWRARWF